MKLLNLEVKNWFSYKKAKLVLDERGLVLVIAENRDSHSANNNFAGKSALFSDAIPWGLYGETLREKYFGKTSSEFKIDDVVRRESGKDCMVGVQFIGMDNQTYRVNRYRKDSTFKNRVCLYCESTGKDLTGETDAETNAKIVKITGVTYQAYCHAVIFAQGPVKRFTQSTDKERREVLEEFFNMDVYTQAREFVAADVRKVQGKIDACNEQISLTQGALNLLKEDTESLKDERKEIAASKAKWNHKHAVHLKRQKRELIRLNLRLKKISTEHAKAVKARSEADDRTLSKADVDKYLDELDGYETKLARHASTDGHLRNLIQDDEEAQRHFKAGDQCDRCLREMRRKDVVRYKKVLADRLEANRKKREDLEEEIAKVRKNFKACDEVLKHHRQALTHADECQEIVHELDAKKSKTTISIKDLEAEITQLESEQVNWSGKLKGIDARIAEKAKIEKRHLRVKKAQQKEIEKFNKKMNVLDFWLTGFSPFGLKDWCFTRLLKRINAKLKYYSRKLTRGELKVWLEKNAKGQIAVKMEYLGSDKYIMSSSGQCKRADLCIALAFRAIIEEGSSPVNLRIMDEFDQSLDERGLDMLINLMVEESGSVFLITHNTALAGQFNNVSKVVYENKESKLIDEAA